MVQEVVGSAMADRILVIDGHPDPDPSRCSHAIAAAYAQGARESGRTTYVTAIATLEFTYMQTASQFSLPCPHQGIREVQSQLTDADHIVLIYPLWLGTMPALLRTFLEQLAGGGVATCNNGKGWIPNLRGKSARAIVTMDARTIADRWIIAAPNAHCVEHPILRFLGVSPIRVTLFGRAGDLRLRERRLRNTRELGARGA
jgi:putative NADPH-quinone reductase